MELKVGQKIEIRYQGHPFEVIVINPHAFGRNRPSIGIGFRMQERLCGLSHATISQWKKSTKTKHPELFSDSEWKSIEVFELPNCKKKYAVYPLPFYSEKTDSHGDDYYKVIEIKEFINMCFATISFEDVVDTTKEKISSFLEWFTVKNFYVEVFTFIKGSFDRADNEKLSEWLTSRLLYKEDRKPYAKFIVELHENIAFWTNYTYLMLFGKIASEMRKEWATVDGKAEIARNHIPQAIGLEAVGFVERTVVEIFTGNLREAHLLAIKVATKKFDLPLVINPDESKLFSAYSTLKLSEKEVRDIVELHLDGGFSLREIAQEYGVSDTTVKYHCQRRNRKMLPDNQRRLAS